MHIGIGGKPPMQALAGNGTPASRACARHLGPQAHGLLQQASLASTGATGYMTACVASLYRLIEARSLE